MRLERSAAASASAAVLSSSLARKDPLSDSSVSVVLDPSAASSSTHLQPAGAARDAREGKDSQQMREGAAGAGY